MCSGSPFLRSIQIRIGKAKQTGMTIQIRSFARGDLSTLVALWNKTMAADPISQQRLLLDYVLDPHFDPNGLVLATDGNELAGFAFGMTARPDLPSDNAVGTGVIVGFGVAEQHRRQGIGTALIQGVEEYFRAKDVSTIQVGPWVPPYLVPGVDETAYAGTVEFLEAQGYAPGAKPVSMRALLTGYEPSADVPEIVATLSEDDIWIRPAVADDATDLIAFAIEHFPHWESYVRGAMRSTVLAAGDATLHIALDGDTVIGFAMTSGERFGPFGVNGDYRGRGIGAVLLSRALCAMRAANVHLAYFLWTSDQTARLYNRHGFEIVRRFTMMSKRLS